MQKVAQKVDDLEVGGGGLPHFASAQQPKDIQIDPAAISAATAVKVPGLEITGFVPEAGATYEVHVSGTYILSKNTSSSAGDAIMRMILRDGSTQIGQLAIVARARTILAGTYSSTWIWKPGNTSSRTVAPFFYVNSPTPPSRWIEDDSIMYIRRVA